MALKPTNVVVSLKAPTMEELILKQLINNKINGDIHYNYFQVDKSEEGYEIFFFADISNWNNPEDLEENDIRLGGLNA